MTIVDQKENETRKDYLVRVAILLLKENAVDIGYIGYDEVKCDAFCLAEDLRVEFDIDDVDLS